MLEDVAQQIVVGFHGARLIKIACQDKSEVVMEADAFCSSWFDDFFATNGTDGVDGRVLLVGLGGDRISEFLVFLVWGFGMTHDVRRGKSCNER